MLPSLPRRAAARLPLIAIGLTPLLVSACGAGSGSSSSTTLSPIGHGGAGGDILGSGGNGGTGNHGGISPSELCGPGVPGCVAQGVGPSGKPASAFPLPTDDPKPSNVDAQGVGRDENGWIGLDVKKVQSNYLWIADDMSYGVGLVSKVHTEPNPTPPTYREVARYATFTCQSDPTNGSREGLVLGQPAPGALCADGVHGCCTRAEASPGPGGGHQGINAAGNRPSRTAVDFNGDMWVANRAHGLQPSVSKIAGDPSRCIDRNGNGTIDTSSDVNGDGIITTDCNDDNLPDDGSTVCSPGKSREFYGLDDECVLFTVNIGQPGYLARALALAPGDPGEFGNNSIAWAGTWQDGTFYKINGDTGAILDVVTINPINGIAPNPYGAAIDQYGILWAPNEGTPHLFYFDTNDPTKQGMVTADVGGTGFYGIAVDGFVVPGEAQARQQVWLGEVSSAGAYRYRPRRDAGFDGLGQGTWALAAFDSGPSQGRGIGVDNRKPTSFAWVALDGYANSQPGGIGRIPTDIPDSVSTLMAATSVFTTGQTGTLGAGVASNLDLWAINQGSSSAAHFTVDAAGHVTGAPDLIPLDDKASSPDNFCPMPNGSNCRPNPYTYSDFTGFGLVNFTSPKGYYSWVQAGCPASDETRWYAVEWEGATPPGTSISVVARTADSPIALASATFTGAYDTSPANLQQAPGPVTPNPAAFIEVRFVLTTTGADSPKLKGFNVAFACESQLH